MLFQVYGDTAVYQWIGWVVVFLALIGFNEIARRTKAGGITCFLVIPAILTAYFIAIYACVPSSKNRQIRLSNFDTLMLTASGRAGAVAAGPPAA